MTTAMMVTQPEQIRCPDDPDMLQATCSWCDQKVTVSPGLDLCPECRNPLLVEPCTYPDIYGGSTRRACEVTPEIAARVAQVKARLALAATGHRQTSLAADAAHWAETALTARDDRRCIRRLRETVRLLASGQNAGTLRAVAR